MDDMTLAERVARTVELDNELRAIWGHNRVSTAIHEQTHMDVHAATAISQIASRSAGRWIVSAEIGQQWRSPRMYATADIECSTCKALVTDAVLLEDRRHAVAK